jgi:K+-transporting ATPase ATPase C chain
MIRISAILLALLTLITGIIYPLLVTCIGFLIAPKAAGGSLIKIEGVVIGARPIGQNFTAPHYFHPRPSAANYDAAHSTGSNLGPTSQKLADQVAKRSASYQEVNDLSISAQVPADALHASASGLDPHISFANALAQAPRIAAARNLDLNTVIEMIKKNTQGPTLGILGGERVHVLNLNLLLDRHISHAKTDF